MDPMNSDPNILDMPDEILIEIILNLNANERLPLGNSCRKFYSLVFEDKNLLRDLDFSKDWPPPLGSDTDLYFINENSSKHILKVNLPIFGFGSQTDLLSYLHRAMNLVDLSIRGSVFRDLMQVERFLCPLRNLKRLSFDWPVLGTHDGHYRSESLEELLGRLTYWSVRLLDLRDFTEFYNVMRFCHELKELRITVLLHSLGPHRLAQTVSLGKINNIEIIEYYGPHVRKVEECFLSLIPCPEEWTHFQLFNPLTRADGFHLERHVKVCEKLMGSTSMKSHIYNYPNFASSLGGFVSPCLLEDVMKINGEHLQNKFCCFSSAFTGEEEGRVILPTIFHASKQWTLKPEEAKRLLEDPRYQISYLNIFHNIEEQCDAHLVTSAFPSVTELVLSNIIKFKQARNSNKSNQLPNLDSSFSKLVRSLPHVKHLTVIADESQLEDDEMWDLASMHLISGWKSLTSLRLWHIPIMDGNFFIGIGKQCKLLDTIELVNLGPAHTFCYMQGLTHMLIHCTNLRYFTLRHKNINRLSDVLILLANNPQLRRICIRSDRIEQTYDDLILTVEQLLHRCSKLNKFVFLVKTWARKEFKNETRELSSDLERLRTELNRPSFQFQLCPFSDDIYEYESAVPYCIRFDSLNK